MNRHIVLGYNIPTENPLFRKYLLRSTVHGYQFVDMITLAEVSDYREVVEGVGFVGQRTYNFVDVVSLFDISDYREVVDSELLQDRIYSFVDVVRLADVSDYREVIDTVTLAMRAYDFVDIIRVDDVLSKNEMIVSAEVLSLRDLTFVDSIGFYDQINYVESELFLSFIDVISFEEPEPLLQKPEKEYKLEFTEHLTFNEPQ